MRIGVPKERKPGETRVGLMPAGVKTLTSSGHEVVVEAGAGLASGIADECYQQAGAQLAASAEEAFRADLIVKVKEPQPFEIDYLQEGQILFTFLHLAADPNLAFALLQKKIVAIAYEMIQDEKKQFPILLPMSRIAGRIAALAGAYCLQFQQGGQGVLLGGLPGVSDGEVIILGAGHVGSAAAEISLGLGALVHVLDIKEEPLQRLAFRFGAQLRTHFFVEETLESLLPRASLLISSVLLPGRHAPKILTRRHLRHMKKGAVFADVAIDQGGSAETSRPTTHEHPIYDEEGILHYCVANMPAAYPATSTKALTHATWPYLELLARGKPQIADHPLLASGVVLCHGKVTHPILAEELNVHYTPLKEVL